MKVRLYTGSQRLVERSGVGQALHHQAAMLKFARVETTERNEQDVSWVHINTVFPDSLAAALLAKFRGQRVVYYGHSTMEDFRNSFRLSNALAPAFRRWICLCYSLGDVIITPTEYSKELLQGYGLKKPIYALSNGVDTDFFTPDDSDRPAFRQRWGLREGEKAVISVGHTIARKGLPDFIALARRMPEAKFLWFGYTAPGLIPAEIRREMENAPENLRFAGFVSQEELRQAYRGCDLFCFMSYEETEGIVVLEALACGTPVLLRDIPVYRGWLSDGENIYKARDLPEFERKARAVLGGTAPDLRGAGRAVTQEHSLQYMGRELLAVYREAERKELSLRRPWKRPAPGALAASGSGNR